MNTDAYFEEQEYYHVYNRSNNNEKLFREPENYRFFLSKFRKYLTPFVKTYAYALLKNHFHFLISVKSRADIILYLNTLMINQKTSKIHEYEESGNIHNLISHQFSRFFISYSQAYNKKYGRNGNLFNRRFKRAHIEFENRFGFLQYYIHHNARKHGVVSSFKDYPFHSYHELVRDDHTWLERSDVYQYFKGKDKFIEFHESNHANNNLLVF